MACFDLTSLHNLNLKYLLQRPLLWTVRLFIRSLSPKRPQSTVNSQPHHKPPSNGWIYAEKPELVSGEQPWSERGGNVHGNESALHWLPCHYTCIDHKHRHAPQSLVYQLIATVRTDWANAAGTVSTRVAATALVVQRKTPTSPPLTHWHTFIAMQRWRWMSVNCTELRRLMLGRSVQETHEQVIWKWVVKNVEQIMQNGTRLLLNAIKWL